MNPTSRKYLGGLRQLIDQHFGLDEIQLLCFDLGLDFDHVAGDTKPLKIHHLLLMLARQNQLPDLLELVSELRDVVAWPAIPETFDLASGDDSALGETAATNQFQVGDVAAGATVIGNIGEGASIAGNVGPNSTITGSAVGNVLGAGAALNVQSYHITGSVAGDVNIEIAGDVKFDELPIPPPPSPEQIPSIDGFVGREQELQFFTETLQTVNLAVISGMAGIGKTMLAAALAQRVAKAEDIFWHTFHKNEGVETIIWKLAGFLAWHGQDDLWQLLQRARLTRGSLPPPETLLDYLRQMLGGRGFLICIEDLHHVENDPQLGLFVERMRAAVLAGELAVIITSRHLPEFVTIVETAFISGLTIEATHQLIHNRGAQLSKEQIAKLHAHTQGNAELLMLSIELLLQARNPERLIDNLAEVEDIERFMLSEIDGHLTDVEPDVMRAVSVLALFGQGGTRNAVTAILDGQNVRRVLRDLSDRFLLLVYRQAEIIEYGQHAIVQSFYYDALNRRQRQAMHRLAGEYYLEEDPNRLKAAYHFELAGESHKAIQLVTGDLWELLNLGQGPALVELFQRFRSDQLEPEEWVQLKLAQGQVFAFLGESDPAQNSYEEGLAHLESLSRAGDHRELKARYYRGLGELLQRDSPQEALGWLQKGLNEVADTDSIEKAGLYQAIGTIQVWLGDYQAAATTIELGLDCLPPGPSQLRATALENLGVIAVEAHADIQKAVALTLEAKQISENLRDTFKTAEILSTLGSYRINSGDWANARQDFQQSLDLAKQLGSKTAVALSEINLGSALIDLDQDSYEQAQQHLEAGRQLAEQTNQLFIECISVLSLAELYLRQELLAQAEEVLFRAGQIADQLEDERLRQLILLPKAQFKLANNQLDEAYQDAKRSVELAREISEAVELGISLRVFAQVLLAQDQPQKAFQAFEESQTCLIDQYPYEAARTQMEWGSALVEHGETQPGLALLNQARLAFEKLGAQRDLATITAHMDL